MSTDILPAIFKYNAILSLPLFAIIAFFLIRQAPTFSLSVQTISKALPFLERSSLRWIFRLNFILKALLDIGFVWYVLSFFEIPYSSPLAWMLPISSVLFGSLAYFTDDAYAVLHKIIIYTYGVLCATSYIYLARITDDRYFVLATYMVGAITSALAFYFLLVRKTNVYVQVVCTTILYIWLLFFVIRYL